MTETETGYVYTLNDPRTDEPRYVGASVEPRRRLKHHLGHSVSEPVEEWLTELSMEGYEPYLQVVATSKIENLGQREVEMIERISDKYSLLNEDTSTGWTGANYKGGGAEKNIKLTPDAFEQLKQEKPEGETWSRYLTRIQEAADV